MVPQYVLVELARARGGMHAKARTGGWGGRRTGDMGRGTPSLQGGLTCGLGPFPSPPWASSCKPSPVKRARWPGGPQVPPTRT